VQALITSSHFEKLSEASGQFPPERKVSSGRLERSQMFLVALMQGISEAAPLNPIARWTWVFPVIETIHICGFTLLVGTIAILDLRLLGVYLKRQTVSQIARDLAPWILTGMIIQLITGPYLLSSDAGEYIQVAAFRTKMVLFATALIYHFTVIRKATTPAGDAMPLGWRRPAALVSLGLWVSVLLAGLWIGNL
jgi:heme A synthase